VPAVPPPLQRWRHRIGVADFSDAEIDAVFDAAASTASSHADAPLAGRVVGLAFFQPSTRTRLGFQRAVLDLGGRWIGFGDLSETRSVPPYGESLSDSMQVLARLADIVVLRSGQSLADLPAWLGALPVPLVNAGDGTHEHPLQALTDASCIRERRPDLDALTKGLVGDLESRVVRSLVLLLVRLGVRRWLSFAAPGCTLPGDLQQAIRRCGGHHQAVPSLDALLADCDVVELLPYRIPDRPGPLPAEDAAWVVTRSRVQHCNPQLLLLHPGPRSWELSPDTDTLPGSLFFEQVRVGCAVKRAVLRQLA
jgi:aspartate carbamoyltransferase catalytic subunit